MMQHNKSKLAALGVYGFDHVEAVILASLVTEDPLLLIGPSGTGKTYLLNSLSETLNLEHRHFNASPISFYHLVGFPFPDSENGGVKFLETPATVWGAQSVLIDEISRCKPEHQNRLFSLVHERRLQGIRLNNLRFRWAAMNPCNTNQSSYEDYSGSEPLDPALADRFSLFVKAADWNDLSEYEKARVADPAGEGAISEDHDVLKGEVERWREEFQRKVYHCPAVILAYVTSAATLFNDSKVRISPRRTRLMTRSLLAASIVTDGINPSLFKTVLECSLPQLSWGEEVKPEIIAAVHLSAWETANARGDEKWITAFHLVRPLAKKLTLLLDNCPNRDAGTQAVEQLLANEIRERAAVFAYATFPAAVVGKLPVGAEAVNDLGKIASPILMVDGEITWQERISQSNSNHPEFVRYSKVLKNLKGARLQHATQFFKWCLVANLVIQDPSSLEEELNECINILKKVK